MVITYNSAKEIWHALKKKYSKEDAGFKKYVVGRFLDFKNELENTRVTTIFF